MANTGSDIRSKMKMYFAINNIKQVDVAMGIRMPPSQLSAILNSKRKLEADELFRICDFIKTDPKTLREFNSINQ